MVERGSSCNLLDGWVKPLGRLLSCHGDPGFTYLSSLCLERVSSSLHPFRLTSAWLLQCSQRLTIYPLRMWSVRGILLCLPIHFIQVGIPTVPFQSSLGLNPSFLPLLEEKVQVFSFWPRTHVLPACSCRERCVLFVIPLFGSVSLMTLLKRIRHSSDALSLAR